MSRSRFQLCWILGLAGGGVKSAGSAVWARKGAVHGALPQTGAVRRLNRGTWPLVQGRGSEKLRGKGRGTGRKRLAVSRQPSLACAWACAWAATQFRSASLPQPVLDLNLDLGPSVSHCNLQTGLSLPAAAWCPWRHHE